MLFNTHEAEVSFFFADCLFEFSRFTLTGVAVQNVTEQNVMEQNIMEKVKQKAGECPEKVCTENVTSIKRIIRIF